VDIATLQAYGYFFFTAFLVAVLYGYIYHLYSAQKKGTRDYEKYGNIALHDDITDQPIEEITKNDEIKK
jgi:cytochrome c oxidase cbb3-type subunit IV